MSIIIKTKEEIENKTCQNCKNIFTLAIDDFLFYKKIKVPLPTWCPQCRFIRRAIFRNEHYLFKKVSSKDNKEIFSAYPKESFVKIYDNDFWWSDAWNPMDHGFSYDFSVSFFEQFHKLQKLIPLPAMSISNSVNSNYCNNAMDLKNCYMAFSGVSGDNLLYGVGINNTKDSVDFYHTKDSSFCYETFSVIDSYKVFYSTECAECRDVWFSINCRNCNDCFGCVNLRHKKYCIFNEQYTEEEYRKRMAQFNLSSYVSLISIKSKVKEFQKGFPIKFMHTMKSPDSSGDYVYGSKNVKQSFHIYKSENIKFSQNLYQGKDSYDYTISGLSSELIYESVTCGGCSNLKFCFECWPTSSNLEYCMVCFSCNDCFGCIGLNKKQYCIFNKQYTKENYFSLKEKIIEQMNKVYFTDRHGRVYKYGEFFPIDFSPFCYNESLAFDYLPMSKKNASYYNYPWYEAEKRNYEIKLKSEDLPDNVTDTKEDLINQNIECAHLGACECNCSTAFKIIKNEFDFYKRFGLPIPRICPNCRFNERIKQLNSLNLYNYKCCCSGKTSSNNIYKNKALHFHTEIPCPNEFKTPYAPENSKIIYCEKCYQQEVD